MMLRGFFRWCESRDLIAANPLRKVKLFKPTRQTKWAPSMEVVNSLLNTAAATTDPAILQMLATLAFTGMRSGELVNLRRCNVDLVRNWIHIRQRDDWTTKTGANRKIPIHPRLKPYLVAALKAGDTGDQSYLFTAGKSPAYPHGGHLVDQDKLLRRLQSLAEKIKLPVGHKNDGFVAHSLRHFFETFCVNHGAPQRAVDVWLGHVGDRSTGALYYQLSDSESQRLMTLVPFEMTTETESNNQGEQNAA